MLLTTHNLTRRYAGLVAVDAVDLEIPEGGIHAVIGPNGAGKTTLFNLLTGIVPPSEGGIVFDGQEIAAMQAHRRAALGMARTFQNIRLFSAMSVLENVLTGLHPRLSAGLLSTVLRLRRFRAEERDAVASAKAALAMAATHQNVARQPAAWPSAVPAGTPSTLASARARASLARRATRPVRW